MTTETATTASAVGAIATPYWLPALHDLSVIAAEWAPILGCAWLSVQIAAKVIEVRRRRAK